jgi:hypothetical protein
MQNWLPAGSDAEIRVPIQYAGCRAPAVNAQAADRGVVERRAIQGIEGYAIRGAVTRDKLAKFDDASLRVPPLRGIPKGRPRDLPQFVSGEKRGRKRMRSGVGTFGDFLSRGNWLFPKGGRHPPKKIGLGGKLGVASPTAGSGGPKRLPKRAAPFLQNLPFGRRGPPPQRGGEGKPARRQSEKSHPQVKGGKKKNGQAVHAIFSEPWVTQTPRHERSLGNRGLRHSVENDLRNAPFGPWGSSPASYHTAEARPVACPQHSSRRPPRTGKRLGRLFRGAV